MVSVFTSCIKQDLDELPAYDEAEIVTVFMEHRYIDPTDEWIDGSPIIKFKRLEVAPTIVKAEDSDDQTNSVVITASVPAPSGSFTPEERTKISLDNIVVYMNISTAAKVTPLNGAPLLGTPGDYTQPRTYRITAADGKTSRDWVVTVNPLPIINQYEGAYACTGEMYWDGTHFDGQGTLYNTSRDVYLSSFDETTCVASHGASIWTGGYSLRLKVNADNSVTVTQHDASGNEVGEMVPGAENSYDPTTKTFTINYRSQTNDPYIGLYSDTFVLQ